MATTIHGFPLPAAAVEKQNTSIAFRPNKRISRHSRRALRMLAHAIEYVANEFLRDSIPPGPGNARLRAVQMLMAAERKVHAECPDGPSFADQCQWFFRPRV